MVKLLTTNMVTAYNEENLINSKAELTPTVMDGATRVYHDIA